MPLQRLNPHFVIRFSLTRLLPVALLFSAACSSSSPTGPSANTGGSLLPGSTSGATISGAVAGVAATTAASAPGGFSAKTAAVVGGDSVTVVGTDVSALLDSLGRFTLTGVPAGTQRLQFSGPRVSGQVTVSDIQAGDTIELSLSATGTDLTLETERRSSGMERQIEGRVEALPLAPPQSLTVAGLMVTTNANTRYFKSGVSAGFSDLEVGQRVHVKGQTAGTAILAATIDIQNVNVDLPVNVNGVVSDFSGSAADFDFTVEGRKVEGDAETEFFGGSQFSDLANGVRVEVKGQLRDGRVYATRIHVNVESSDDDDDTPEVDGDFAGRLTSFSGTTPPITLVIDGRTVTATAATELRRRGDRLTFAALQTGLWLEVSATSSGGSLVAKKLTIGESDFDVDIEGAITGSVTGTCPTLTFTVGSLTLKTTSFTEFFKTSCSAIATGATVKVRGVLLSGGTSAEATRVEVKTK